MIKAGAVVLSLTGAGVGFFVLLSSEDAGGVAALRQSSDVSAPAPAPAEDAIAVPSARAAKALSLADAPARVPLGQHMPSPELPFGRARLTRDIQLQLKRVGCYHGQIDEVWSPTVRKSMKAFTDRVNAVLPVEQPEIVLLALLQNHQGTACGVPCPPGESLAADARCLLNTLITSAARKQTPAGTLRPEMAWPGVGPSEEPRMALAGPSLPPAAPPGQPTDAPAKASPPRASPPVGAPSSRRFPAWAARAFESR